jgi:hypothetical protein
MTAEPAPESVTPEALTLTLRRCGVLGAGRVSAISATSARSTVLSRIVRLSLAYEGEAGSAPPTLIFKTGLPERMTGAWSGGRQEVEFYTKVAAATPAGVLPRCFEADWDAKTNHWRLLLEDLTTPIKSSRPGRCRRLPPTARRFFAPGRDSMRTGGTILV